MPRNVLQAKSDEIRQVASEFQVMLEHYGVSMPESQYRQYFDTFRRRMFEITKDFSLQLQTCPPDHRECPGGGCVPQGRVCS